MVLRGWFAWFYNASTATEVTPALQPTSSLANATAKTGLILVTHQLRHQLLLYCTEFTNKDVVSWPNKAQGTVECPISYSTSTYIMLLVWQDTVTLCVLLFHLFLCHQQCQLLNQPSLTTNNATTCWSAFCMAMDNSVLYRVWLSRHGTTMLCVSFSRPPSTLNTKKIWHNYTVTIYI